MKRLLRVMGYLVNVALVIIVALAAVLAYTSRRSPDGVATIKDYKVLTVLSGSMEPAIHTGDAIIIKRLAPGAEIKENDVITFRGKGTANMMITHRVKGMVLVNGKPGGYLTKGDANESADQGVVTPEQIVGRYQFRLLYLGYVSSFMHKPLGIALCVILPGLVLIGLEFRKMWLALVEAEAQKAAAEKAEGGERPEQ